MPLYSCPVCLNPVSGAAPYCPRCGHPIAAARRNRGASANGIAKGVFLGLAGCFVLPYLIGIVFMVLLATCEAAGL